MERIRSIPLLRLLFTVITGIGAGAFFVGMVLLAIYLVGLAVR